MPLEWRRVTRLRDIPAAYRAWAGATAYTVSEVRAGRHGTAWVVFVAPPGECPVELVTVATLAEAQEAAEEHARAC